MTEERIRKISKFLQALNILKKDDFNMTGLTKDQLERMEKICNFMIKTVKYMKQLFLYADFNIISLLKPKSFKEKWCLYNIKKKAKKMKIISGWKKEKTKGTIVGKWQNA